MSECPPLSQIFLAQLPALAAARPGALDLEAQLQAVVERGRTAWPEIHLAPMIFVEHLAQRLASAAKAMDLESLANALRELHAEDLYLACACLQRQSGATAALSRRFIAQIPTLIAHMRLTKEELEDICQILSERLLIGRGDSRPRIAEYSGRGALLGWIRMAALREALDRRRGPQSAPLSESIEARAVEQGSQDGDPQQEYLKRRYRQHFEAALRTALSHLSAEQRNILRLHFLDGLSIDKLGALFKVHRATAARWIVTAQRALLAGVRADLQERLQLNLSEVDSIARLVRSQLHLSLPRLLLEGTGSA